MLCKGAESQSQAPAPVWDVTRNGSAFPLKGCPGPKPGSPHPGTGLGHRQSEDVASLLSGGF